MAEITAALVKDLREKSGVGMMDCKKALQENDGDIEAAIDWLRTKGLSKAAKKADRVAAEGLVAVAVRDDGAGKTGAADRAERRDRLRRPQRAVPERRPQDRAVAGLDADGVDAITAAKTVEAARPCQRHGHQPDRHHRREHAPAPLGPLRRWPKAPSPLYVHNAHGAGPRPHRRARGPGRRRRPGRAAGPGPQDRHARGRHRRRCRCRPTTSTRPPSRRNAQILTEQAAGIGQARRPSSRRWSKAGSASSRRKSCC